MLPAALYAAFRKQDSLEIDDRELDPIELSRDSDTLVFDISYFYHHKRPGGCPLFASVLLQELFQPANLLVALQPHGIPLDQRLGSEGLFVKPDRRGVPLIYQVKIDRVGSANITKKGKKKPAEYKETRKPCRCSP